MWTVERACMVPPLLCPSLMVRYETVAHSLGLDGAPIAMLKPDGEMWDSDT